MTLPFTTYGRRELLVIAIIAAVALLLLAAGWPKIAFPWIHIVILILMVAAALFFRDPKRTAPVVEGGLLSPADGKITDICQVEEAEFIKGPALRIGIFLSVLDVHINRAPCAGQVKYVQYHPGKCLNALRSEAASAQNTANCLGMECPEHPAGKIMVKQITGAIARRIVCGVKVGDKVTSGEKYGMIKFGSRTELFVPAEVNTEVFVKVGDTVRAGLTVMAQCKK